MIKDHKITPANQLCPPTRPVCSARDGPQSRLSHFLSLTLNKFINAENYPSYCDGSEQLKFSLAEVNKIEVPEDCYRILICQDANKFFPSLKKSTLKQLIIQLVQNSKLKLDSINWQELMKLLTVLESSQTLAQFNLAQLSPTYSDVNSRNENIPSKPTLANLGTELNKDGTSRWNFSTDEIPDSTQLRTIVALSLSCMVVHMMSNHVYSVGQQIHIQEDGGPIGTELAQVLGKLSMLYHSKQFTDMMDGTDMHLLLNLVYEDDITNAADVPKNGRTYEQAELDTEQTLNAIANSIVPEIITVESDRPGKHPDNQVSILDLKVGPTPSGQLQHQHYRKPMANPGVVWSRSGLSSETKRTILFREGLRRLTNCSPELTWSIKAAWLSDLNFYMRIAGHSYSFRQSITKRITGAYNTAVQTGQLYRGRQTRCSDKEAKGGELWFKQLGYDVTASVPVTVGNKLADTLQKVTARTKWKVKFIDMCGPTVIRTLMRANHNPPPTCNKPRCLKCLDGPSNMKCHAQNISYRMVCTRKPCSDNLDMMKLSTAQLLKLIEQNGAKPSLYEGQSFCGPYIRGKQPSFSNKLSRMEPNLSCMKDKVFVGHISAESSQGKVKCLNSKLNFVQPLMSNINVSKGNRNFRPGQVSSIDNAMPNSYTTQILFSNLARL